MPIYNDVKMAHFSRNLKKYGQIVTILHALKHHDTPSIVSLSIFRKLAHILL